VYDSDPEDPAVPYAGTAKLGMYKWPWRGFSSVIACQAAGVSHLEMYVGPARFLKNTSEYLDPSGYDVVAPKDPNPNP
jgi:hypothetical protein